MNTVFPDGIIELDSEVGRVIGFTSERFDGYLWKDGRRVWISLIASKQPGKGHLSALFAAIEAAGLQVAVPTPLGQMQAILERKGFARTMEETQGMGWCEVWTRPDPNCALCGLPLAGERGVHQVCVGEDDARAAAADAATEPA